MMPRIKDGTSKGKSTPKSETSIINACNRWPYFDKVERKSLRLKQNEILTVKTNNHHSKTFTSSYEEHTR